MLTLFIISLVLLITGIIFLAINFAGLMSKITNGEPDDMNKGFMRHVFFGAWITISMVSSLVFGVILLVQHFS